MGSTDGVKELYLIPKCNISANLNVCLGYGLVYLESSSEAPPSYARSGRAYSWSTGLQAQWRVDRFSSLSKLVISVASAEDCPTDNISICAAIQLLSIALHISVGLISEVGLPGIK